MSEKQNCGTSCSSGSCSTCHVEEENRCPECGNIGVYVPFETVHHLANSFIKEQLTTYQNDEFYLCTHRACKLAYYTNNNGRVFLNQIKVPVWFKHDKDTYLVCYCRNISLDDIKEAVNNLTEDITKEKVIQYLNKVDIKIDCLHNNPTGMCCDRLFDNAISYAIKNR